MALSGSLSTTYKGYTYRIDWAATQNVGGNYSDVKLTHKLVCGSGWDLYIASHTGSATVGGVSASYTAPKISTGGGTTITLGTTTHRIQHNADGSKANIAISCTFNFKATIQGTYKATLTASGTITLNTIPRASQPSCITFPNHTENVGFFGDEIGIHMNRASSSFTHTVRYEFGSVSEEIATGVTNGVTWTIPLGLMNLLPSTTKGSGRIFVDTYNGSTLIGTKYCGFTAYVPESVKPSCKTQVLDATTYKDTYGNLIKGLSKLQVNVTGTAAYSSPIVSSKTHVAYTPPSGPGVQMQYTGLSFTTSPMETSGTVKLKTTVTDSRGRTSDEFVVSFPIIDYIRPKITALSVHRCDADGTENDQGSYISVDFSAEITPLNDLNSALYGLRYKRSDEESYTATTYFDTPVTDKYHLTTNSVLYADPEYAYDVEVVVQDDLNTVTRATSASTGFSLMDWGADGTSIRFGGVADESHTFRNDLKLHQTGNRYAYQPSSFNGDKGYTLLAEIKLNTLNVNAPIVFVINRRGALCPMQVYVRFASSSSTTDPDLGSIAYEGDNYGAFLYKSATSTWRLYVDNTSGWSNPCLQDWFTTDNQMSRISVSFPTEQVAELPTPYYRATPAKMQSLIDFIYPVGSIYLSYNHEDPGTLFGGTWARIENAFLWGVDSKGAIGTRGGVKEHKLTVDELPAHNHGPTYSHAADGDKQYAWYTTAGDKIAYGSFNAGAGAAHNNMPPYVQVSIWRRTA